MTQPAQYTPTTDFSQDEANSVSGRSNVRTAQLDTEFINIQTSINQLVTNIGLLQRDDGALLDGIVTMQALSAAVTALFVSIGANPRGAWVTATAYAVKDIIETGSPLAPYMCVTAHTSGVFATDYAAHKWVALGANTASATNVVFTPTGTVAATNAQTAIAEVASEAVQKSANGSDFASIATTRTNLSVPSIAEVQTHASTVSAAGGTSDAITGSYTPAITPATDKMILFVRAGGANTSTTPTFTPNSGVVAAKTIKKSNLQALVVGDIAGSGHVLALQWNSSDDSWTLLNPAFPSTTFRDTDFIVSDNTDTTKKVKLEVSGVTTGTTRTLTVPNQDSTLVVQGDAASAADMESVSSTTKYITPANMHRHPGVVKVCGACGVAGDLSSPSYGVTSITDSMTGEMVVVMSTSFSSTVYVPGATTYCTNATLARVNVRNAGSFVVDAISTATDVPVDPNIGYTFWALGDH